MLKSSDIDVVGLRAPPWKANPRQLFSRWDMEQFSLRFFFEASGAFQALIAERDTRPSLANTEITAETMRTLTGVLEHSEALFKQIDLPVTASIVSNIRTELGEETARTFEWAGEKAEQIQEVIRAEMGQQFFFCIPAKLAKFWPTEACRELFGKDVANAFPSSGYDIQQAGIALATSLSTACVFHLMRALEVGLRALGGELGLQMTHENWGKSIDQIEKAIAGMRNNPTLVAQADWRDRQEFYSQPASHFIILKNAWRNFTMHDNAKYTEAEAEQIFSNTRAFMQKLAEKLHE
jgi:hypothetical protein